jgi:hypothetical protein
MDGKIVKFINGKMMAQCLTRSSVPARAPETSDLTKRAQGLLWAGYWQGAPRELPKQGIKDGCSLGDLRKCLVHGFFEVGCNRVCGSSCLRRLKGR